jgi:hypothetical protein
MTIHLDWGEAEFWQQYESVNESVIATTDVAAPARTLRLRHPSQANGAAADGCLLLSQASPIAIALHRARRRRAACRGAQAKR